MMPRIVCGYTDRTENIHALQKMNFSDLQHCVYLIAMIKHFSKFTRRFDLKNGSSQEQDARFMLSKLVYSKLLFLSPILGSDF